MAEDHCRGRGLAIAEPEIALLPEREPEATSPLLEALERVRSTLDRERAAAPAFCAELLALPPETALERIRGEACFQTWGLCELLLAKSTELAAGEADLAGAAHCAALALAGAERLGVSRHAAAVVEDLKARAWAALGEAHRLGEDLAGAEKA